MYFFLPPDQLSHIYFPQYYFTAHPGDLMRSRLIEGCSVMLVASAHWDDSRNRFRLNRPPAGWVSSMCVDSGGFTAAKRWGRYPWTVHQYTDFIHLVSRDVRLDFCAIMDYACEPNVNRSILATNKARIKATIRNDVACRCAAPDLPWLSVLQGDNLIERAFDFNLRKRINLLPTDYAGIGSVCGRGARGAIETIKFYRDKLPGVKYHVFGMHIQSLDDDIAFETVRSWDSYGWNWGRGQKGVDRPPEYLKKSDETFTEHTKRLATLYWKNTIEPRLKKTRQGVLL